MNIFFDTEFTTLDERYHDAKLISIGLVDERGENSFYAELDHWEYGECSNFTRDVVLPLLEGGKFVMDRNNLGLKLKLWIEGFGEDVVIWTDAPDLDWRWLRWIFNTKESGGWPSNLVHQPVKFEYDAIRWIRFTNVVEASYSQSGLRRHHALDDAEANRRGWQAAMRRT